MANINFSYTRNVRKPLNLGANLISSSYTDPVTITLTAQSLTNLQSAKFITNTVGTAISNWNSQLGIFSVTGARLDVNTLMSQLVFIPSSNGTWYNIVFDALAKDGANTTIFNDTWSMLGQANNLVNPKPAAPTQVEIVSNFIPTEVVSKVNFGTITGPLPVYDYSVYLTNDNNQAVDMTSRGTLFADSTIGQHEVFTGVFDKNIASGFYYASKNGRYLIEFTTTGSNVVSAVKYEFQSGGWVSIGTVSVTSGLMSNTDGGGRLSNDGNYFSTPAGKFFNITSNTITEITPSSVIGSSIPAIKYFNVDNPDIELIQVSSGSGTARFEVRRGNGSGWSLSHSKDVTFSGTSVAVKYGLSGRFAVMSTSSGNFTVVRANYNNTTISDSVAFNKSDAVDFEISPNEDAIALLIDNGQINTQDWNGSSWVFGDTITTTSDVIQYCYLKDSSTIAVLSGTTSPFTLQIFQKNVSGGYELAFTKSITGGSSATWRMYGGVPYDLIRMNFSTAGAADSKRHYVGNDVLFITAPLAILNATNSSLFYNKLTIGSTTINKANIRITDMSGNDLRYTTSINKTTTELNATPGPLNLLATEAQAGYFTILDSSPGPLELEATDGVVGPAFVLDSSPGPLELEATDGITLLIQPVTYELTYTASTETTYKTGSY